MNYEKALELIGNRKSKKLANNTYLIRDGENLAVRLHSTNVITFKPNGDTVLNSGGWKTVTTRDRIGQYMPNVKRHLIAEKGVWYIEAGKEIDGRYYYKKLCIFRDGVTITKRGKIIGGEPIQKDTQKKNSKLLRRIKKYVQLYMQAFVNGEVPVPSHGDCLYCNSNLQSQTGQTIGETFKNKEHLLSHFEENYFVPSLLANAMKRFKVSPIANDFVSRMWCGDAKAKAELDIHSFKGICISQLSKSLYRYIKEQFGMQA